MIVHYLNIISIIAKPLKANSELIVYPNTVLANPFASQLLKPIRWRNS